MNKAYLIWPKDAPIDDIITSIIFDKKTYNLIWNEINSKNLVDNNKLCKENEYKVPLIEKSEKTEHLFNMLNVQTSAFCGCLNRQERKKND